MKSDKVVVSVREGEDIRQVICAGRGIRFSESASGALAIKCGDALVRLYAAGEWTRVECQGEWYAEGQEYAHDSQHPNNVYLRADDCTCPAAHAALSED